ncbi:Abi family protein [Sulfurimonas xiamenensis]|uniref:Abi-like protein n=1 Tax=Sulfurimonas xiamenensis TaxID=2590021 RepID=A0AAJ4A4E9_9BACT|nr:Abi family protein [Sulfurimonas xiamenensis]QFR43751.1 hypothetical protein FJR47_07445 [Sulfurimonas xiamenensis]
MKDGLIKKFITDKRFQSYADIYEYEENLHISKRAYIPLSILEVSLRNSIDALLSDKVDENWHTDESFLTKDSVFKINQAIELLQRRRESVSKHKIIAELSFGFWVNLFKKPYDKKLRINDLKKIFPNLPPKSVALINREKIYKELNHIRNFRNRVFHYEKVVNKDGYNMVFEEINEILRYFDNDIYEFATKVNN